MVQKRIELENLHERMNGLIFDVEYGVDAVKSLRNSDEHFNVKPIDLYFNCLFEFFFSFRILRLIWKNRVILVNK
jgi:hypothetical protein